MNSLCIFKKDIKKISKYIFGYIAYESQKKIITRKYRTANIFKDRAVSVIIPFQSFNNFAKFLNETIKYFNI